ncbi:MAG: hypothetical protein ACRD3P_17690 [Terriglobales bacterium]
MQIITPPLSGIDLGFSAANNTRMRILAGTGDPNSSATDSSAGDLASSAVGSLYLRNDGGASTSLYVKTALSTTGGTGTWTAK